MYQKSDHCGLRPTRDTYRLDIELMFREPSTSLSMAYFQRLSDITGYVKATQIDPIEMKAFLSHVMLLDMPDTSNPVSSLKFRLVGTEATHVLGELTGEHLHDVWPDNGFGGFVQAIEKVIETREPVRLVSEGRHGAWSLLRSEGLVAPLFDDNDRICRFLVVIEIGDASLR